MELNSLGLERSKFEAVPESLLRKLIFIIRHNCNWNSRENENSNDKKRYLVYEGNLAEGSNLFGLMVLNTNYFEDECPDFRVLRINNHKGTLLHIVDPALMINKKGPWMSDVDSIYTSVHANGGVNFGQVGGSCEFKFREVGELL